MNKTDKILIGLAKYMIEDHAIQCTNKRCWCYASVFNDTLAELKEIDPSYKDLIQEIWDRERK